MRVRSCDAKGLAHVRAATPGATGRCACATMRSCSSSPRQAWRALAPRSPCEWATPTTIPRLRQVDSRPVGLALAARSPATRLAEEEEAHACVHSACRASQRSCGTWSSKGRRAHPRSSLTRTARGEAAPARVRSSEAGPSATVAAVASAAAERGCGGGCREHGRGVHALLAGGGGGVPGGGAGALGGELRRAQAAGTCGILHPPATTTPHHGEQEEDAWHRAHPWPHGILHLRPVAQCGVLLLLPVARA
eukprot:scaffold2059_cov342-Prasinococcus_capsulatus_cf.AAC.3